MELVDFALNLLVFRESLAIIWVRTNLSDVFTNSFHEFFSTKFSQFERWKKKTNFILVQIRFFGQFSSWKRNHYKHLLKKFVDSEFEIGEIIWWVHRLICISQKHWDDIMDLFRPVFLCFFDRQWGECNLSLLWFFL